MHGIWMYICSHAHSHGFKCTNRPEVVIKCLSLSLSILCFETRFLPTSLSEPFLLDWLASTPSGSLIPALDFQPQGYSHALPGMAFRWVLWIQIQGSSRIPGKLSVSVRQWLQRFVLAYAFRGVSPWSCFSWSHGRTGKPRKSLPLYSWKAKDSPGPQTSKICPQLPKFLLLGPTLRRSHNNSRSAQTADQASVPELPRDTYPDDITENSQ